MSHPFGTVSQVGDIGGWELIGSVRNPWGRIPMVGAGQELAGGARDYMDRLISRASEPDPRSRRHHYVPQSYLRQWSADGRRIWSLDTATKQVAKLGIRDVCVEENFHRVVGSDDRPHNRIELMFGVVDEEIRRVQTLFNTLQDPDSLGFDDLVGLGVSMAVQRMRTAQQRRLRLQFDAWLAAQAPSQHRSIASGNDNPFRTAGIHTQLLFSAMWDAADVMTLRQIEIWHDIQGRFMTCDAPVLVPFIRNVSPDLHSAPYVLWPISPTRAIALTNDLCGEKAVIIEASGKQVGLVRTAVEKNRERKIFASEAQHESLPSGRQFRRRPQIRLRCSQETPRGEHVLPPGCCVEQTETFSDGPDVKLCEQGLHVATSAMNEHR